MDKCKKCNTDKLKFPEEYLCPKCDSSKISKIAKEYAAKYKK